METEDDFDFELAEQLLEAINSGDTEAVKRINNLSSAIEAPVEIKKIIPLSRLYQNNTIVEFNYDRSIRIHNRDLNSHNIDSWIIEGEVVRGRIIDFEKSNNNYVYYITSNLPARGILPPISIIFKVKEYYLTLSTNLSPLSEGFDNMYDLQGKYLEKEKERKRKEEEEKIKKENEEKNKLINSRIEEIKTIAEEIHPGSWDFAELGSGEFRAGSRSKYRLTIHFPEITISNSEKSQQHIKDLYVSSFFDEKMNHISPWYGARTTISYPEMRSNYRHSHLHTRENGSYDAFCLGIGTSTADIVNGLVADGWNAPLLRKSLIQMYGYVAWESLEGGPYIKMGAISAGDQSVIINVTELDKKNAYNKFIDIVDVFPAQFANTGNINSFLINEKDEEFEILVSACTDVKVIKTVEGNYVYKMNNSVQMKRHISEFNSRMASSNYTNEQRVRFKGSYINIVCKENIAENDNTTMVAAPQITKYIAEKLEEEINNYKLKMIANELS